MTHTSDQTWIQRLLPRFRLGLILPGTSGVQRGVDYQFYRLVPLDVMALGVGIGIRDYSAEGIQTAMSTFWSCIQTLVDEGAEAIILSGVPVSAGLGRERILSLTHEVPARTGVPFDATLEAIVASLGALGTSRIALASRFPVDTNAAIASYLSQAGVEVLGSTARDLSLSQARQLSMQEGMQLALDVGREAHRTFPNAEAILIPGGAMLSLHAIPALEAELGKPVLTNLSAEVWSALISRAIVPPVSGWGRLLAQSAT